MFSPSSGFKINPRKGGNSGFKFGKEDDLDSMAKAVDILPFNRAETINGSFQGNNSNLKLGLDKIKEEDLVEQASIEIASLNEG